MTERNSFRSRITAERQGGWKEVEFDAPKSWEEFAEFARTGNMWWLLGKGYATLVRMAAKAPGVSPDAKLRLVRYIERRCERECGELLPLSGTGFRYGSDDQVEWAD